jgi:hypothetical protein
MQREGLVMTDPRRALLTAALGFLQLRDQPPEVTLLRRWLDSWAGLGDVVAGLPRLGLDVAAPGTRWLAPATKGSEATTTPDPRRRHRVDQPRRRSPGID